MRCLLVNSSRNAVYTNPPKDHPLPSRKTKMVQYLGTKDSNAYKEMKAAIERRNEIQRLERKLQNLEKEVSVAQQKKRQPKEIALTKLVGELVVQVERLREEIELLKKDFSRQLSAVQLC